MTAPAETPDGEAPAELFDVHGDAACWHCFAGDRSSMLIVPPTRSLEHVGMAAWVHWEMKGHDGPVILCIRGADGHVHAHRLEGV